MYPRNANKETFNAHVAKYTESNKYNEISARV